MQTPTSQPAPRLCCTAGQPAPTASGDWCFDSQLAEAHRAAGAVRGFCVPLGLGEVGLLRIEHCIYEAFVNVVQHAYAGAPGRPIRVAAQLAGQQLRLMVCQRGVPLDPAMVAAAPVGFDDLLEGLDLGEVSLRGRGLRIIKASMEGCEACQDGDWHCLCMTQTLPG